MVKEDGEAAKPQQTLETATPDGKICKKVPDGPNLRDSMIRKEMETETRVSADGGDDMSVTLAELSSNRAGKRGTHQLKDAAKEGSGNGDGGLTDEKSGNISGGDSSILRRSRRNRIVLDPGDKSKKIKKIEEQKPDVEDEDEDEDGDDDDDEDEEDESEFSVGDFVWGKVKSHPWWPGRVFNPSDASQQALKYKHEGRILVAYFGDATFAWCDESQLKPFVENFAEMSKQSSAKSFLNAVEAAVTEFGRLVELDMTCYCTPRTEQIGNHQASSSPLNAGIRGGVNVNKGGIGIYSVDKFDPAAFLSDLRIVGKKASVDNLLELATLKGWVSAVYRSKDGPLILKVNELQEGEEDGGIREGNVDSSRGPVEEPVQVIAGIFDPLLSAKRKERSVAEILYGDEKTNEDSGVVEGEKSAKTDLKSGKKKRKVENENKLEEPEIEIEKKLSRRSSKKELKVSPKPVVESNLAALEESEMSRRTRERKKSKYFFPPYTNFEYYRQTSVGSPRGQSGTKAVESSLVPQSGETSSQPASVQVNNETSKKKVPKEDGGEHGKANGSAPVTPRRASTRKVKSVESSNNVLSGIRAVASGELSKGDQSLDAVKGFLTSYRSSKYQNESSCNPEEAKAKKKTKEVVDSGKYGTEPDAANEGKTSLKKCKTKKGKNSKKDGFEGEVTNEEKKSLKKSETKNKKAKSKNKAKMVDTVKDGNITGTLQSAALHLKFPSGYAMPSKDDLGALYGKFGELDTSKTKVYRNSFSAKLVFLKGSDAEVACESSKKSSPFGEVEVSYRIRHLKGISEEKEADENGLLKKEATNLGKRRRSTKRRSLASASNGGLRLVKQKLEEMTTMVADAGDGKISREMKSDLESKLKDLLSEVKALPALPSTS